MLKATLKLMPDGTLCSRLDEDPRAMECLFERHIDPLTKDLEREFYGNGIDCAAIAAEALVNCLIYASLHKVEHFHAYIYKAAFRLAIKAQAYRFREVSIDTLQEQGIEPHSLVSEDIAPGQIEEIWMQQAAVVLKEAMRDLTPNVRNACLLFYIDGKMIYEIADHLGISKGAAKDRLHEGRKKMKAHPKVIRFCEDNEEVRK